MLLIPMLVGANQDVGLDGLSNSKEGDVYTNWQSADPNPKQH
jgi:hypothetical protein